MAQTTICIRIDDKLKKEFEKFCDSVGMSMSTGINIFIKKSVGERKRIINRCIEKTMDL